MNENSAATYVRPRLPHEHPTFRDNLKYIYYNIQKHTIYHKKRFTENDQGLKLYFSHDQRVFSQEMKYLAENFIQSFKHYSYHDYSRANFPGLPSLQGTNSDSIEGAARSYPLLAVYLRAYHLDGEVETESLKTILKNAFLAVTNQNHKGYWGKLQDYSQTICETADFALSLWISKDIIWQEYDRKEQEQIINWLSQINHVQTVGNNWHLFVLLVQFVIIALTGEGEISHDRYEKIKALYVGEGWFRDGVVGNFDYYNSWGFHYPLFWLDQINPHFDRQFIHQAAAEFSEKFKYFFTAEGFPFFGRSIPYRFAAPCGLIAQMIQKGQPDGQVKRIIQTLHQFFISHGAIKNGTFTQGLFQHNRLLLDSYSGSGSSLWSLRSLILLLFADFSLDETEQMPLEVEKSDFDLTIVPINLRLIGNQKTKEVIAIFEKNDYPDVPFQNACLTRQGVVKKMLEQFLGRSTRGKNNLLRKGITTYSSKLNLYLP